MNNSLKSTISKILPTNKFARGVSILVGGTASAQLLALLAAPVLTRLYSPEDFGVLAVYIGVISLFSVVASLKYELAIPLPEDRDDAVALTILSLTLVSMLSVVIGLCIVLWGGAFAELFGIPGLAKHFWLVPLGIFLAGTFQILNYRAVREKEFSVVAKARLAQQLGIALIQISTFKLGGIGLLLGQAAGQGFGIQALYKRIVAKDSWHSVPFRRVRFVAFRYKKFPLFTTWGGFLNTAGAQVPPILFAALFGANAAGVYALAHRVIALPMSLIGQAVSQVFLSNAAIDYRKGKLPKLVISAQRALIKIIVPPVVFLILFGPKAFPLLFGNGWAEAGEVASWLALWMLVAFSTSPLSAIFTVIERQGLGLVMQGFLFLARLCGIAVGVYYQDFMLAVIWFSIFNVFGYLIYQLVAFWSIDLSVIDSLKGYFYSFFAVVVSFLLKENVSDNYSLTFFIVGMIFCVIYYYKILKSLANG